MVGVAFKEAKSLVFSVISILIFSILLSLPPVFADPCTTNPCPVQSSQDIFSGGANQLFFREINSLDNSTVSASLDNSAYHAGDTATLTINDFGQNLDPFNPDAINPTISSGGGTETVPLTETDVDNGVFKGTFPVTSSGDVSVNYAPQENTARVEADLNDVTTDGSVEFSDYILNDPNFPANQCFDPVIQAVRVNLVGATIGPTGYSVTLSYADGLLRTNPADTETKDELASKLQMYFIPDGGTWGVVTANNFVDPGAHDLVNEKITSDPIFLSNPAITTSGLFTLGLDNGCAGGGSSGIVSAGFVLNLLAGSGTFDGSHVSPPTFGGTYNHYTDGLTITEGSQKTIFDTSKYNQDIPTQVMVSGKKVNMDFKTFEAYNPNGVIHMGLYIIPHGQDMITTNSIGSIIYDKNSPVQVSDPNHILSDATASIALDGKFQHTTFSFVPTKSYDKMSFLARAWNDHLQTTDIRVHDAIDQPAAPKTLSAGVVQYDTFDNLQAALEKDGFYKPQVMAHIHSTTDVFSSDEGGQVYWLYDAINHNITLVIEDKNGNEVYSDKAALDQIVPDKKGDYGFMQFTSTQLNRDDKHQEENAMKIEEAKALLSALAQGIIKPNN